MGNIVNTRQTECENLLKLLDKLQLWQHEEWKRLWQLVEKFRKKSEEQKKKLPYHLNVIDQLHINENVHSRILFHLLQFQNSEGTYEILKSLIENFGGVFQNIHVDTPNTTQEESRIDVWVRDRNYAIIFENKIYNASDQPEQLGRYIDKTKGCGYDIENIYVVYLSPTGEEPDDQSWGKYKEEFGNRYINFSFRNGVLPWLKECVLPNIRNKDYMFKCAVEQYIDYLEGLFDLRTINKQMNMEIKEFISKELELDKCKDAFGKAKILQNKIGTVNNLLAQLVNLAEQDVIDDLDKEINEEYKKYGVKRYHNKLCLYAVSLNYGGNEIIVSIQLYTNKLFCVVESLQRPNSCLSPKLFNLLCDTNILNETRDNCQIHKHVERYAYTEIISCFKKVLDVILK